MKELLSLGWWFSFFGEVSGWWFCVLALGVLILPLAVRWFRGLPDRGIGMAPALGVLLTNYTAWVWSFKKSGVASLALLIAAGALVGWALLWRKQKKSWLGPLGMAIVVAPACLSWPHKQGTIVLAALALAAFGCLLWAGHWGLFWREVRRRWTLWVAVQILFTLGFLFFANVRSYIPWATFEPGMSGAEKFDNFAHLNSCYRALSMPPEDGWWAGRPINYYYGGHLISATMAKLVGKPAAIAFNLGLAMVFALSLTSAFSLTFNVINRVARFWRPRMASLLPLPALLRRSPWWVRGMGWGLLGAAGVAFFGNIDPWQQAFSRDLNWTRGQYDTIYAEDIKVWRAWSAELDSLRNSLKKEKDIARKENRYKAERKHFRIKEEEIQLMEANPKGRPPAKELSDLRMRFTWPNLLQVDFWRSSRMIKGSITEFPYFSAILGDHHAHHYALPFSMLSLIAAAGLLRKGARFRRLPVGQWLGVAWPELLAMGFFIGAVFPINAWDAIVLGPLFLLAVLAAMMKLRAEGPWRWATLIGIVGAAIPLTALILNARPKMALLLQSPAVLGLPILYLAAMAALDVLRPEKLTLKLRIALFASLAILMAILAKARPNMIMSDILLVFGVMAGAAIWQLSSNAPRWRWWGAALAVFGAVGFLGLFTIIPFKLFFHSPFIKPDKLMVSLFPPMLSPGLWTEPDFFDALWKRVSVNPFPSNLQSEVRDYAGQWGQFLIPILFLWFATLNRVSAKWGEDGRRAALRLGLLALLYSAFNLMDFWTGPLTLTLCAGCVVLVFVTSRDVRHAPVWVFLSTAFFYSFFVEVLHFDDGYSGELERYNTPFKIYYPLWAPMTVGMCVALKELVARRAPKLDARQDPLLTYSAWTGLAILAFLAAMLFERGTCMILLMLLAAGVLCFSYIAPLRDNRRAWLDLPIEGLRRLAWRAPLILCVSIVLIVGMLYPAASTATRTNWFANPLVIPGYNKDGEEKDSYTKRTLDAITYLGNKSKFKDDTAMIRWMLDNIKDQAVIIERIGEGAYQPGSRFATNTGMPTVLGWEHHELQWRGWGVPVPKDDLEKYGDDLKKRAPAPNKPVEMVNMTGFLREQVDKVYRAATYEEIEHLLKKFNARYIMLGSLEREAYAKDTAGLAKFDKPPFKKLHEIGKTAIYEVAR